MDCIVFIAAVSRYFEQYHWDSLDLPNRVKTIIITGTQLNKKYPVDAIYQSPISQITGEPNARFEFYELRNILISIGIKKKKISLICIDEGNIEIVAQLREEFNIDGPKTSDVLPFSNKLEMYQKLTHTSARLPLSYPLNDNFDALAERLGLPFIVKPESSSGTFGVQLIYSYDEFLLATTNKSFCYLASEYINGELYHCDLQYQQGTLVFSASGQYLNPLLDFMQYRNIGTIILDPNSELNVILTTFTSRIILELLKQPTGSFHAEVFINQEGNPVFLEAAYRPPGGGLIPLYERCFNVNLCNQDLQLWLNNRIKEPEHFLPCFAIAVPTKKGKVLKYNPPNIHSHCNIKWNVNIGEHLSNPFSIADKAMVMFAHNVNYEELMSDYLSLKNYQFYELG